MSAVTIEPAELTDVDAVVALWRDCELTRPWNDPVRDFQDAVMGETSTVLVARDRDAVVGAVMAGYDGHRGWLYYLGVAPGVQGSGHGRALVVAAEAWLAAAGCSAESAASSAPIRKAPEGIQPRLVETMLVEGT